MFNTVEDFLAMAATYQTCTQLELVIDDAKRRLAVGTFGRKCHQVGYREETFGSGIALVMVIYLRVRPNPHAVAIPTVV